MDPVICAGILHVILGAWRKYAVEDCSTIPLNRDSSVANIFVSGHGESNSRAQCPLPRVLSSENPVLSKACTILDANHLVSDKLLTLNCNQLSLNYQDYEEYTTEEDLMALSQTSPASNQISSIWEEDFQDLTHYCQDSKLSRLAKVPPNARENLSTGQDDELNTPEIGHHDFNFDPWVKMEPIEDNYLWEENPFGKVGGDYSAVEEMFSDKHTCILPDESNMGLVCLNIVSEETVEETQYISQVEVTDDVQRINMHNEVISELPSNIPSEHPHLITRPLVSSATETQVILETPAPEQPARLKAQLTLPLKEFENSVVLNTPEVLDRLNSQPEFDIVKYILEDNAVGMKKAEIISNPCLQPSGTVHTEIPTKTAATVDKKKSSGNSLMCTSEATPAESNVCANNQNHPLHIVLKKKPSGPHLKPATNKRERKVKTKYIIVKESHESSSDEEYMPTSKRRKRVASCSSKAEAPECSRYRELRDRNNEASRKSRLNRKAKEEEMNVQAAELESENRKLKYRAEELEKLVDTLRKALLAVMVKSKE